MYQDAVADRSGSDSGVGIAATALLSILAGAAYAADWDSPVRTALGVAFLLLAPGLAIVEALEVEDVLLRIALVPGVSITAGTLVSVSLVYAGWFSSTRVLVILEGLTFTALAVAALRRSTRAG